MGFFCWEEIRLVAKIHAALYPVSAKASNGGQMSQEDRVSFG
jgi:hypothetical protein